MIPTQSDSISLQVLASWLAPALGDEQSQAVVSEMARQLGLTKETLSAGQAQSVLSGLSPTPGLVGVACRFASSRLDAFRQGRPALAQPRPSSRPGPDDEVPPKHAEQTNTVTRDDIVDMLGRTLGRETSEAAVDVAARSLGIRGQSYDRAQALALLEYVATTPGLTGVTARFAKARLILKAG